MARWVCKFGGSSLATPALRRHVAEHVIALRRSGHEVVMVLSACQGETDRLLAWAFESSPQPHPRELDALLVTGEMASAAMMAMVLESMQQPAQSFQAHQAGLMAEGEHGRARLRLVDAAPLETALQAGIIPVVCGFQGWDGQSWKTLGRGGSDTTAVVLAQGLQADACRIYTDVTGVFHADPRWVPDAPRFTELSYADMTALAEAGAKVLHPDAARWAEHHQVPLHILSTQEPNQDGTWVVSGPARLGEVDYPPCLVSASGWEGVRLQASSTDSDLSWLVGRLRQKYPVLEVLSPIQGAYVPSHLAWMAFPSEWRLSFFSCLHEELSSQRQSCVEWDGFGPLIRAEVFAPFRGEGLAWPSGMERGWVSSAIRPTLFFEAGVALGYIQGWYRFLKRAGDGIEEGVHES